MLVLRSQAQSVPRSLDAFYAERGLGYSPRGRGMGGPTVVVNDTTSGSTKDNFNPGDYYTISITGAAAFAPVSLTVTNSAGRSMSISFPTTTDINGNWSFSTQFANMDAGTWKNKWTIGSDTVTMTINVWGFDMTHYNPGPASVLTNPIIANVANAGAGTGTAPPPPAVQAVPPQPIVVPPVVTTPAPVVAPPPPPYQLIPTPPPAPPPVVVQPPPVVVSTPPVLVSPPILPPAPVVVSTPPVASTPVQGTPVVSPQAATPAASGAGTNLVPAASSPTVGTGPAPTSSTTGATPSATTLAPSAPVSTVPAASTDAGFMAGIEDWMNPSQAFGDLQTGVQNFGAAPMFTIGLLLPVAVLAYLIFGRGK